MLGTQSGHVFVSYSRRDEVVMRRIVQYLREQGIKAWVDNEKLVPGTPIWEREIEKAIDAAYAVVVVLSPDAKESVWVLNELTLADEYNKRVFPVLVRGDFRESVHVRLVTRQLVDLRTNEERGLESLSAALSRYLDEMKRLEEEGRQAARREAEKQTQEDAKRLAQEKRLADEAENERLVKAKAQRLVHERTVDTERLEKEKVEKYAAQEAEERRAEINHEAEQFLEAERRKAISSTDSRLAFLESAQKRALFGATLGITLWVFAQLILTHVESWSWVISVVGCALGGLIIYPHKLSLVLCGVSFLVWGIIGVATLDSGASIPEIVFMFISVSIFYGLFTGGLISRLLYWLKVIS